MSWSRSPSWNLGRHSAVPPTIQEHAPQTPPDTPVADNGNTHGAADGALPDANGADKGSPDPVWRGRPASPFGDVSMQATTPVSLALGDVTCLNMNDR